MISLIAGLPIKLTDLLTIGMYIVIFITAANKKEAKHIAKELLRHRLVACVNIIDRVRSLFWWQAKIDRADEVLLIIKSKKSKFKQIVKVVKSLHSYEVPEIISLSIIAANKDYLEWLDANTR